MRKSIGQILILTLTLTLAGLATAADGDTTSLYAKQTGPWTFEYLPLRAGLHHKIVEGRLQAGTTEEKPRLIFTAGPFGAGKSFVTSALEKLNLLDVSKFLWIDPDSIKEEIPEYQELKKTNPENAATLVHRESGHIQEELFEKALKAKKNIIVDGSLRAKDWWTSEFSRIRQMYPDYSISIISVGAPEHILLERVESRGRVTGRFIPDQLVIDSAVAVKDSVAVLSKTADLTVEIENGITPAIKSVIVKGQPMASHFDLSGQLGHAALTTATVVAPVSTSQLEAAARQHSKVVVLAGYGPLGYEDFSILKSYVDKVVSSYGGDTLFVLSHQNGIGRAYEWISDEIKLNPTSAAVVVANDDSIAHILANESTKATTEVVCLRGEHQDAVIVQLALAQQVPVMLVRDASLDPEAEAVAIQLTKNPNFDSDPTFKFETTPPAQSSLRLVRHLEVPAIQRVYEERTRNLRNLFRRIETISDQELVQSVLAAYPELILLTEGVVATPEARAANPSLAIQTATLPKELNWLAANTEATYPKQVGAVPEALGASLASALYGKNYAEFDRTISALLLFKRLISGDYEGFTQGQAEAVRLSRESFLEMSKLIRRVAFNPSMRDALFSFLIFNNIGKSETMISYLKKSAGIQETNHQRVMSQLLKLYPFISPTFQRLDEFQRKMVLASFEKEFNLAQLAQGEAPQRFLSEHAARTPDERDFYLATSILKISAARGQDAMLGSLVMTQPTYGGIKTAIDGLASIENSVVSISQTYNNYLRQRGQVLFPDSDAALWMTRLCLMFRCQNAEDGRALERAYLELNVEQRTTLKNEFHASGFGPDSALLLYYGPATLDNLRKNVSRSDFFGLGVELLAKVLRAARFQAAALGRLGVTQVRLDSVAKQIRDGGNLAHGYDVEIYNDANFGISARLEIHPAAKNAAGAISDCVGLLSHKLPRR